MEFSVCHSRIAWPDMARVRESTWSRRRRRADSSSPPSSRRHSTATVRRRSERLVSFPRGMSSPQQTTLPYTSLVALSGRRSRSTPSETTTGSAQQRLDLGHFTVLSAGSRQRSRPSQNSWRKKLAMGRRRTDRSARRLAGLIPAVQSTLTRPRFIVLPLAAHPAVRRRRRFERQLRRIRHINLRFRTTGPVVGAEQTAAVSRRMQYDPSGQFLYCVRVNP